VNLCCGRNPWKRASPQDPTFLAYLKGPEFLRTILPLSVELNSILRRIFECDPRKRISIAELRNLILDCPRFTVRPGSALPVQQPCDAYSYPKETCEYVGCGQCPPSPPPDAMHVGYISLETAHPSLSDSSSISSSSSSSSSGSSVSSCSEYPPYNYTPQTAPQFRPSSQIPPNFWGSFIPFTDVAEKTGSHHQRPLEPAIVVC
jgi:hypothetical protein